MRVPFEWLKEFIEIPASAAEVAHRLTMVGLEVEDMEHIDGDVVLEVNVTPNRPDCLSIIGMARELSAIYKTELKFPEHLMAAEASELDFNVDILDIDLCRRYAGRVVKNLKIAPSPYWLLKRLEKCGIRSINNVVDITNYVLLEFGHPLHAFDLNTIKGNHIRVGTSNKIRGKGAAIRITTLDGVERAIPEDSLLIWDSEVPIAIAGVMGGLESEVSYSTTDIFIESAYFDPVSVRKTSKALGLKTESSYRFERGTDIKMLKKALDRAALLMKVVANCEIYGKIDIYSKRYILKEINMRYEKVNEMLGLRLSKEEIVNCLRDLGFEVKDTAGQLKTKPPTYRSDIKREADIVEEVARTYGYDKIPAELPKATISKNSAGWEMQGAELVKRNIKDSLLKLGFTEVINYSFMSIQDIDMLSIKKDDKRRNLVQIMNPLKAEDSFMKTSLIPSLIKNLTHNVSHGNRELRLFEIAKVFFNKTQNTVHGSQNTVHGSRSRNFELPEERCHLAALLYKEKIRSLYKEGVHAFYIVKGVIEAILNDLKIYDYSFVRSSEPYLHPGQSADIFITGDKIGHVGALSPAIINSLDIKGHKPSIFVMELDIDSIIPYSLQVVKYMPLPRYPFVDRDTAIVIDLSLEAAAIMQLLKSYSLMDKNHLIEDVSIFDVYQGTGIPEGKKSIAFNVRYRSTDRTLKDDEIDIIHGALVKYILDRTKGQIRS